MVSPSLIPYLSCTFHPDCALLFHLCQIRHYYSNSFSIFRNSTSFTEANAYTGTQLKDSYALYGIFISLWGLTPMFHFYQLHKKSQLSLFFVVSSNFFLASCNLSSSIDTTANFYLFTQLALIYFFINH